MVTRYPGVSVPGTHRRSVGPSGSRWPLPRSAQDRHPEDMASRPSAPGHALVRDHGRASRQRPAGRLATGPCAATSRGAANTAWPRAPLARQQPGARASGVGMTVFRMREHGDHAWPQHSPLRGVNRARRDDGAVEVHAGSCVAVIEDLPCSRRLGSDSHILVIDKAHPEDLALALVWPDHLVGFPKGEPDLVS